jgi:hypothetical protein
MTCEEPAAELPWHGHDPRAGIASEMRALTYIASRYGYDLTSKDED